MALCIVSVYYLSHMKKSINHCILLHAIYVTYPNTISYLESKPFLLVWRCWPANFFL